MTRSVWEKRPNRRTGGTHVREGLLSGDQKVGKTGLLGGGLPKLTALNSSSFDPTLHAI
jgi:hypothetical protein